MAGLIPLLLQITSFIPTSSAGDLHDPENTVALAVASTVTDFVRKLSRHDHSLSSKFGAVSLFLAHRLATYVGSVLPKLPNAEDPSHLLATTCAALAFMRHIHLMTKDVICLYSNDPSKHRRLVGMWKVVDLVVGKIVESMQLKLEHTAADDKVRGHSRLTHPVPNLLT